MLLRIRLFHLLRITTFLLIISPGWLVSAHAQPLANGSLANKFDLIKTTISDIHWAFRNGSLTSEQLVSAYLERIRTYDQPTKLNSVIVVNHDATATACALDAEFWRTGKLRPLHGIPVIVKDNFNTKGLQTTVGSVALRGFIPTEDAYQVRKLRFAGAIVLAKSNMAEWAFIPMHSQSSKAGDATGYLRTRHPPPDVAQTISGP